SLGGPVEESAVENDEQKQESQDHDLGQQRPVAGVPYVEAADVVERHALGPFAAGAGGGAPGARAAGGAPAGAAPAGVTAGVEPPRRFRRRVTGQLLNF